MRINLLSILLIFSPPILNAQFSVQWEHSYGGSSDDQAFSIKPTVDGGYIIAGETWSTNGDITSNHGSADLLLLKIDGNGNVLWENSLGGSSTEGARSVIETFDSSYVAVGYTYSNNGDITLNHGFRDAWITKTSNSGQLIWQKTIGGSMNDALVSVQQTSDRGFITAGYSSSNDSDISGNHGYADCLVVKLDSSGNIIWQKSFGGSSPDWAQAIICTSDGGYLFCGFTSSNDGDVNGSNNGGYNEFWIVKLNSSGNIEWQQPFGGSANEESYSLIETDDHYFVITGDAGSINGTVTGLHGIASDVWTLKLDQTGNLIWQKCLGGSNFEYGMSITNKGNQYIILGNAESIDGDVAATHGQYDYWLISTDSSGNILWNKCFGGSKSELSRDLQNTLDGGLILAGTTYSNDGDVHMNHDTTGNSLDIWIVKLSALNILEKLSNGTGIYIYPNPSNGIFLLQLPMNESKATVQILDSQGRLVYNRIGCSGLSEINLAGFSKGLYLVKCIGNYTASKKLVIN
jgi:hypothetical protein